MKSLMCPSLTNRGAFPMTINMELVWSDDIPLCIAGLGYILVSTAKHFHAHSRHLISFICVHNPLERLEGRKKNEQHFLGDFHLLNFHLFILRYSSACLKEVNIYFNVFIYFIPSHHHLCSFRSLICRHVNECE